MAKIKGIDTIASLEREYNRFCAYVGVELSSADEHLFDERLNIDEQGYLRVFIRRWETVLAREDTEKAGAA